MPARSRPSESTPVGASSRTIAGAPTVIHGRSDTAAASARSAASLALACHLANTSVEGSGFAGVPCPHTATASATRAAAIRTWNTSLCMDQLLLLRNVLWLVLLESRL